MATIFKEALSDKAMDKAIEKAAEAIDAFAEQAKDKLHELSNRARGAAPKDFREGAWQFADRARSQAGDIADRARAQASDFAGDLYARGQQTASAVGRRVEEQPYLALAVVGIFALMLGYTLRGR